ncbi:AraC family transcriptional regulator [Cereibacter johrii]|uniref:AraC family transcriptional regulator n=1 Tax=Cereibacter johrii TaxID=445629 RepID=A0ABX5J5Q9_9RHOB|nr:AraC family transcriptional regulator [Cereibacter johrii]ODM44605.1 AraC family transcriptional regulator [Cereibacter johrii]PTM78246.1 AraC family transcriptional regulator [Cereibacter johrii]
MDGSRLDRLKRLTLEQWDRHGRQGPLEGLRISCETAPTGPIHTVYDPSFCVVLQGAKTSRLGDRAFRYDAGKCLIASLEVPIRAEITEAAPGTPYLAFALTLDPATVADLILGQGGLPMEPGMPSPALAVHPLTEELIGPLERLLALPARPQDIPVLAPMIRREIVWRLLTGPQGAALRQIGLADSRMSRIGRAIAWIRDHFAEPLSIERLSALAGMSPATFHRHFKAATAMTPVQFQKSLRLQEARRLLISDGADVARVGFAIGYESPSQFSREYRRLFGAPPGRDGAQIRREILAPASSRL